VNTISAKSGNLLFEGMTRLRDYVSQLNLDVDILACFAVRERTARLVEGTVPANMTSEENDSLSRALSFGRPVSFEFPENKSGKRTTLGVVPVDGHAILLKRQRVVAEGEARDSYDMSTHLLEKVARLCRDLAMTRTTPARPAFQEFEREDARFKASFLELWKKYAGKWIAMSGGKVMDSDADELKLAARVEAEKKGAFVLIRQVVADSPIPIQVETPAF
jgi:hypothetical protein